MEKALEQAENENIAEFERNLDRFVKNFEKG